MEAHFAWWQESAGRQDAGMRSSKFARPFSRAYSTHAAASTDTSALSANVARSAGLFVTFLPYSSTCGQSASQSSRGFLNVFPSASWSAYCVIANMNALPPAEIKAAVDSGYFFMKIKIGQPGTQEEMLAKDMARVSQIHAVLKDCRTPYTKSGKLPYYFDANGRYEKKETLLRFIDHLKKIGAYEQVAIIEEPFDEYADIDVHDIPLRLAADESAHTVKDALERIEMGYRAMALKPIAKTMSMSMKIAQAAFEKGVPCFCADLTVCPAMVEWNKAVAARLPAFPGIGDLGLVETNGHQNFRNWETMRRDLAYPDAHWTRTERGVFECDADYWAKSGGILEPMPRYEKMYERLRSS